MVDSIAVRMMRQLGLAKFEIKDILSQDTPKEQLILADIKPNGVLKKLEDEKNAKNESR
jgi:hypothetical protein